MDQTDDPLAKIYREQAPEYEELVSHEDYEGNLRPALERICPSAGLDVADLGAGTGRLACMLAPTARSIWAFDLSRPMLAEAHRRLLRAEGPQNWQVGIADHRALPLRTDEVDLVVSGWSIVYTVVWHEATWQHELGRALGEIERVLRPGGTVIILETMGTGYTTPNPPTNLLPYFAYLECAGFASTWIRTDYAFANRQEASRIAGFFFGAEIAGQCVGDDPVILPECTGIWWKTFQEEA